MTVILQCFFLLFSLSSGVPSSFLAIFHFAFTSFDAKFTKEIEDMNIELYGKTDFQFMEGIYKVIIFDVMSK